MKKEYINELKKRIEIVKEKKILEEFEVQELAEIPSFIKNEESDEEIAVLKFCDECNTGNSIEAQSCKSCGKKFSKKKIK